MPTPNAIPPPPGPTTPPVPSVSDAQPTVKLRLSQIWGIIAVTLSAASAVSVYLEPWTSQVITMKAELTALKAEVATLRSDVAACTCP